MVDVWNEHLWLPENVTWHDLESSDSVRYPQAYEFWYTVLAGGVMLVLRILVESFVYLPIGWIGGWISGPLCPQIIAHLQGGFAGKSKFKRVAECAWRFSYYLFAWFLGLYILRNQPQFHSVIESWKGWPRHHISDDVWWYYIIETAFYWGLLFSQLFFDVRRADFLQMTFHHTITIFLLFISWNMNMVRVGTLVLFSHDAADVLLELGKLLRYARWKKALEVDFVFFILLWIGTRLIFYPFWIVHSVWFDAPKHIQESYEWINLTQRPIVPRVLVVMLTLLIVLHLVWTAVILKIAYNSVCTTEGVDDIREDSDSGSEDEDEKTKKE